MSFEKELELICGEVPGCLAATVMNLEGMLVAKLVPQESEIDLEVLLVELTASLKQALQALQGLGAGTLSDYEVSFDKGTLVARVLNEEYFVALLMGPKALIGKGRYALRRHCLPLVKELA